MNFTPSVTGCGPAPTMHEDFSIGQRVYAYPVGFDGDRLSGSITGVALTNVFYSYIITLDKPAENGWTTISMSGCLLKPVLL